MMFKKLREKLATFLIGKRGGHFLHIVDGKKKRELKNTLTETGASFFLRDIFRDETTLIATSLYIGLTNAPYTFDNCTLAAMAAGEPVGNDYARQLVHRNTSDWTVQEVNGVVQALSKELTFSCTGAPWSVNWTRAFLCDAASGTSGNVLAVSGPAPSPIQTLVGAGPNIQYQYYLRP